MEHSTVHDVVIPDRGGAPALSGELLIDARLVDDAVARINLIYVEKGLERVLRIGQYVIDTFFQGRSGLFHTRQSQHVSFRSLAQREHLLPSYNWIWTAVATTRQCEQLPAEIARSLSPSHHRALLPVRELDAKLSLARLAIDERLSMREFRAEVAKYRAGLERRSNAGRPPLPALVKGLNRLRRAVEIALSEPVTEEVFQRYDVEQSRQLLAQFDVSIGSCIDLRRQLAGLIEERTLRTTSLQPVRIMDHKPQMT